MATCKAWFWDLWRKNQARAAVALSTLCVSRSLSLYLSLSLCDVFLRVAPGVADRAVEQVHCGLAARRHALPLRLREELLGSLADLGSGSASLFCGRVSGPRSQAGLHQQHLGCTQADFRACWELVGFVCAVQAWAGPPGDRAPPRPGAVEPKQAGSCAAARFTLSCVGALGDLFGDTSGHAFA